MLNGAIKRAIDCFILIIYYFNSKTIDCVLTLKTIRYAKWRTKISLLGVSAVWFAEDLYVLKFRVLTAMNTKIMV